MLEIILDVVDGRRHSRYFNQTRSHFLYRRVGTLALLLGILQPAWILIDWMLLPQGLLPAIAGARLLSGAFCLLIGFLTLKPYLLTLSRVRVLLFMLGLSVFQTYSSTVLHQGGYSDLVAGYHFFPYMIICMMAIFPLTIVEALGYAAVVSLFELAGQVYFGVFGSIEALNALWLLLVLGAIAGWASCNQLSMLMGLYRQASRDPLTGLSNRRQSMTQLDADIVESHESGAPLMLMLFDLDHFKRYNDRYGHAAGDLVLKEFAAILRRHCRPQQDLAGRYGGEEFMLVLPHSDPDVAMSVAEAILQSCRDALVKTPGGESVGFSTSIGLAQLEAGDNSESLLKRADDALYKAKEQGRDQFQLAA
ncbi:GGDEF domain-containing protein [Marinobacterium jannaschii]|uniref:GGDEF domain-containing protein n=1 Tax=Marinobacterium jannaschii TaxID=64970 RepID=UPI00056113FD|nr:GGDEF domain-containing protein [Marinobacterium jannaschii]